jgi:ATP-binding cassette subfamily C protein CydD
MVLGIDKRLIVRSTSQWIVAGIGVGILSLVFSLALYWQLGVLIDGMVRGEDLLPSMGPLLAFLVASKFLLGWLYRTSQYKASSLTKLAIRDKIYQHALRLGPAVLDKKRTGELVNIAVDGMDWIELFYGIYFVQFVIGIVTPVLLCIFIGWVDWAVGVALILSIPMVPLFLGLISKQFRSVSERYAEVNNVQSAQFLDSIQGMSTLKMFNLGKARGAEMHAANENQRRETMKLLLVNQVMILFVDFGFALGTTTVLTIVALLRLDAGFLSAGEVVALILASAEFATPLTLIGAFFFAGAIGREFARKIVAFLSEEPGVQDPPGATTPAPLANPSLRLRDVVFSYANAGRPAVNGCTLEIRPGETVALVGHSGSGKTTVTNLVLRTLAPASGSIALDDTRVDQVPADWVRTHLALVPQDPYLFYGTIADNLRVAKADASEAELIAACQAANIYDHISSLPQGFDTLVGERGLSLSGGQVQRLAIARALLKDAPIIILDEPTSQIDLETETVIHEALAKLTHNRTVMLIAHRLSTVEKADRIIVMGDGRVLETGSHAELLAQGGVYARMVGTTPRGRQGGAGGPGGPGGPGDDPRLATAGGAA